MKGCRMFPQRWDHQLNHTGQEVEVLDASDDRLSDTL
jgi:hypothetical protein